MGLIISTKSTEDTCITISKKNKERKKARQQSNINTGHYMNKYIYRKRSK